MSIQAVAWAISQKVGSPTGKILLICLANYADEHGVCWPSQSTIAKETELSERSTTIWLQKLEEEGFITRRRRHRTDGSRTTDYITLQLGKRPDPSEKIQTAESADRQNLTENRRKPNRSSARSKPQEIHPKEPPLEPSEEPPMGAQAQEGAGFDDLWEAWPEAERPDNREAARRVFEKLPKAEREHAVRHVGAFLVLMWQRNEPRRLFPYLKDRLFLQLMDAPPRARDGRFIITPDRPEWQAWAAESDEMAKYMAGLEQLLCKTRWPEDARRNASSLGNSHATTGSFSAGPKNHPNRRQAQ